jgi:hypothetical protein
MRIGYFSGYRWVITIWRRLLSTVAESLHHWVPYSAHGKVLSWKAEWAGGLSRDGWPLPPHWMYIWISLGRKVFYCPPFQHETGALPEKIFRGTWKWFMLPSWQPFLSVYFAAVSVPPWPYKISWIASGEIGGSRRIHFLKKVMLEYHILLPIRYFGRFYRSFHIVNLLIAVLGIFSSA